MRDHGSHVPLWFVSMLTFFHAVLLFTCKILPFHLHPPTEPKSGTGLTGEWAWGAFTSICVYLQDLYGKRSCQVIRRNYVKKIVFAPGPVPDGNAPCSCSGVKRWVCCQTRSACESRLMFVSCERDVKRSTLALHCLVSST